MAKKKKSKNEQTEGFQYSVELIGLLLVLIGLIGCGFGVVGAFIKKFAMFLVGEWWPILLAFVIFSGFVMIFKRKHPKFFSAKYIGFYLILLVILILSHYTFIKTNNTFQSVINATKDNYMERIATISGTGPVLSSGQASISIGGGFIGAIFAGLFVQLFSLIGTIIVVSVVGLVGVILFFNVNISELINNIKEFIGHHKLEDDDETDDSDEDDESENFNEKPQDNKVVITSVEELKSHPTNQPVNNVTELSQTINQNSSNLPYKLPSLNLLDNPKHDGKVNSTEYIRSNKTILERVLKEVGIIGNFVEIHIGPSVTQYEMHIQSGTKVSRIVSVNKEISLAMAAKDVRIEAPIPGKT